MFLVLRLFSFFYVFSFHHRGHGVSRSFFTFLPFLCMLILSFRTKTKCSEDVLLSVAKNLGDTNFMYSRSFASLWMTILDDKREKNSVELCVLRGAKNHRINSLPTCSIFSSSVFPLSTGSKKKRRSTKKRTTTFRRISHHKGLPHVMFLKPSA